MTSRVQGVVTLEVVILTDGKIGPVRVVQGLGEGLTDKAIECVRKWEFAPAKLEGRPVDVFAIIEVEFKILEETPGATVEPQASMAPSWSHNRKSFDIGRLAV